VDQSSPSSAVFGNGLPGIAPDAAGMLATVESLADGFWQFDRQWRIVFANIAACRTVGQPASALCGRVLWEAFPAIAGTHAQAEYQRAVAERVTVEFEHYYEPLQRWFGIKASPTPDGGLAVVTRDITDARQSQEVLRAAHDTFRHLVENSPFGVYVVDAEFRLVQVAAGARKTFENVEPLLGRDFAEVLRILWPEPFASEAIGRFRHTLASGETYRAPSTLERRRDIDQLQSYDWKIERLLLPDGRPGVVCHFYDLSEQRRLEGELRESEERFRLASDAAATLVYDVDLTGRRKAVVHGLERVTGYDPSEVPLTLDWWYSLLHSEDLPVHRERLAKLLEAGQPYTAMYRIRRKDGAWIWVEGKAQIIKDAGGEPTQVVGVLHDITQRKQALDALRESEQRFRRLHSLSTRLMSARSLTEALEDVLDNAIASCGEKLGTVQVLDPHTQKLDIVAQRGFEQPFLDHFQAVRVAEGSVCGRALQSGEIFMVEDVELDADFELHRHIAAEAGYRAVASTPLKAHDGAILGILSIHFAQPHMVSGPDRQLLELHARHAADLITRLRYEETLREAERRKDEFMATLAHELRGPLAPLVNSLQVLKLAGGKPGLLERACDTMDRQVRHMVRLVDDLMDIGRIKSGKLELRREDVELATVVHHAVEACQPLIERRHHQLELAQPDAPIHLSADPVRLGQVLGNLIGNACKYTERGGHIRVSTRRHGDEVALSVSDTGYGISADLLPHVFDLFAQDERTREQSAGGLGLGLPLVKRLGEMHGGTVSASSEGIGRGSTFTIRLPLLTAARQRSSAPRGER